MKQLTKLILILMSFILLTCNDKITGNNNGNTNNDNNNNNNDNTGGNTPTEPTVYKYADFIGTNYYIYKTSAGETEQQIRITIAEDYPRTNGRLFFNCDYKQGIKETKISCVSYDLIFDVYNATTTQSTFDFYGGTSTRKPDINDKLRTIDFKNKTISYEEEVYDYKNNKITKEILTFPYYSK